MSKNKRNKRRRKHRVTEHAGLSSSASNGEENDSTAGNVAVGKQECLDAQSHTASNVKMNEDNRSGFQPVQVIVVIRWRQSMNKNRTSTMAIGLRITIGIGGEGAQAINRPSGHFKSVTIKFDRQTIASIQCIYSEKAQRRGR